MGELHNARWEGSSFVSQEGGARKECIVFSVFTEKKKIKYNVHLNVMGGGLACFVFWWDEHFEIL